MRAALALRKKVEPLAWEATVKARRTAMNA
jgi:hypothetical protein